MSLAINLALLIFGAAGALLAFFGETIRRNESWGVKRITRLGWVALVCLLSTITLGITKEVRSNWSAKHAIERENDLRVEARERESSLLSQVRETDEKLVETKTSLEGALAMLREVPREVAQPFISSVRGLERVPVKLSNGEDLIVFGGYRLRYGHAPAGVDLRFVIGDRHYPIDGVSGEILVVGFHDTPMQVSILNPTRRDFGIKMSITATGPPPNTRVAQAAQKIDDAKKTLERKK